MLFGFSLMTLLVIYFNIPLHGFRRHIGLGAVAAKSTANVRKVVQFSTLVTLLLYKKSCAFKKYCYGNYIFKTGRIIQGCYLRNKSL